MLKTANAQTKNYIQPVGLHDLPILCFSFFFVKYLPYDGRKRPKHVGGLLIIVIIIVFVSKYCAVVAVNFVKLILILRPHRLPGLSNGLFR